MKKILTIFSFFLLAIIAGKQSYSQPIEEWTRRYNGLLDSTDVAVDIVVDNNGNTYVTGYSKTLLGLLTQIFTLSYDTDGTERWRKEYGGLLWDEGAAITLDNTQQFVYVTGFTTRLLALTHTDYVIIKYRASDGQQMWVRTYDNGLLGDDKATAIAVDAQNNPVITGYSSNIILVSTHDYATVKYDQSNGNQLWAARYNGPANKDDSAYAIAVDNSNNVVVTGSSKNGTLFPTDDDYATVKYNSNGNQQWAARYDNGGEDRAYAIVVDGSGNVIVTGESEGSGTNYDYATVKYNSSNGSQQWAARYNGTGNGYDRAYAIVVDGSGNPIVTGESNGSGTGQDYATVKYNTTNGSQQWAARYNGTGNNEDRAYAIVVDSSSNSYVTGSSRSSGSAGSEDYATLQYDSNGNQQWVMRYNGTGSNEDRAYAIVVDSPGNVYVTGSSRNGTLLGSEDYLTIKYSEKSNPVKIISNEIPVRCSLYQNYPNPFNPSTNIRFDVPAPSIVKITVYNTLGNQVAILLNNKLNPGTFEVQWDAGGFPSGIYFYRIIIGDITETKKMILLK